MAGFLNPEVYIDSFVEMQIMLLDYNATVASDPSSVNDTMIDLAYYTTETYTTDEEIAWIDRNGDGAVNLYEWYLLEVGLIGYNELQDVLGYAASTKTNMPAATIVTSTSGLDSGFYQTGLPAELDTDRDGEVSWPEWIVGHTLVDTTYTQFLEHLDADYAINVDNWSSTEDEFVMRDLDGDKVITWPEYWISQAQFTYWNSLLAVDATTVPLQTFIDAGVSTELQSLYNQANDSIVTIENYVYVQSIQQLFTIYSDSDSSISAN